MRFLESAGELALLLLRTLGAVLRGKLLLRETVRQMSAIGVNSVPIALLTIAFSGMVLALHTANQLKRLGVESLIGGLVAVSMAREAAPVLTAIVVAARVGSAIAAELGTMTVTEQVDALRSLGVNPVEYLVVPRFLAAVLMLPVLTLFANVAGIGGGYIVSVFGAGVHGPLFLNSARNLLQPSDVFLGLSKTFVFGAIIAVVGCTQGLRTAGGAAGVGRSTTAAVVTSIVLVYVADYFLAEWMFGSSNLTYR
jgi:phospholipid/cholesterol/gamma-HCH transport system permease protein